MSSESSINHEFIKKLSDLIETNLSNENFGVKELAQAAGMNYFLLNRRLHSILNKNTSQFIRETRLQFAKEMLEQEEITAAEAAYKTGFGSPAYFNRCFHEYFGYPPGESKKRGFSQKEEYINKPFLNGQTEETISTNFQEQPARKKLSRKGIFIVAAGTLILCVLSWFFLNPLLKNSELRLKPEEKSIAVLPFKNLSDEKGNEWFASGVAENIQNTLTKIQEIKVVTSEPFKELNEKTLNIQKIAKRLGVCFILTGSVQRSDDRILIIVQLSDAKHDQIVWSDKYEREVSDIFLIQTEISKKVVAALQTVISVKEKKQIEKIPTRNMNAYSQYSKGRYLLNLRRKGDIKIIVDYFENAIAADPDYAEAYASLAETYWLYTLWRYYPRPEGFIRAKEFALKALQLDSNLAETHTVMGCLLSTEWKWEEARKEFELAIKLNPNSATARQYYSDFLETINQREEARVQIDIAKNLNPVSPMAYYRSASLYLYEKKYKDALNECHKVVELDPRNTSVYWRYFNIYLQMGDELRAVEALQKAYSMYPEDEKYVPLIKEVFDKDGMKGVLQLEIEYNLKDTVNGSLGIALYYMRLGEKEKALDYLVLTFKLRYPHLPSNMYADLFKSLRNEPRFQALLDSMNLTPYQTEEVNPRVLNK